jgi:hypothetical protein
VKNKWIFKVKKGTESNVRRYTARLVAKGYKEEFGIVCQETAAPVVRYSNFRML